MCLEAINSDHVVAVLPTVFMESQSYLNCGRRAAQFHPALRVVLSPFVFCKVWGADDAVTLQKILRKSFHPFTPLEVILTFSDQGPDEYSKTVSSPFTGPTQWSCFPSEVNMSQRSFINSLCRIVQFLIRAILHSRH